ncbi:MAG: hypothetical protein H7Y60_00275 [Rhodospirillaceae bacterium]|nr:hypothetical protein [Rhodospirillales bacterium]
MISRDGEYVIMDDGTRLNVGPRWVSLDDAIQTEDSVIMIVDNELSSENVWRLSKDGKIIWVIDASVDGSPFCGLLRRGNSTNEFCAFTQSGSKYEVSVLNGRHKLIGASK